MAAKNSQGDDRWTLRIAAAALDHAIGAIRDTEESLSIAIAHPRVIRNSMGGGIMVIDRFEIRPSTEYLLESCDAARVVILPEPMSPTLPADALAHFRAKSSPVPADRHAIQIELLVMNDAIAEVISLCWVNGSHAAHDDVTVRIVGADLRTVPSLRQRVSIATPPPHSTTFPRTRSAFRAERHWKEWRDLRIAIAGCGRSGSLVLEALLTQGVRDVLIVDHDRVERANLDGMNFIGESNIGDYKVDAVAKAVRHRYPHASIDALTVPFEAHDVVERLMHREVIITATDHEAPRLRAHWLARRFGMIHIDIGSNTDPETLDSGADVRVLLPGRACLLCRGGVAPGPVPNRPSTSDRPDAPVAREPRQRPGTSMRSINVIAATLAVDLLRSVVIGDIRDSLWHRIQLSFEHWMEMITIVPVPHPECPWCGGVDSDADEEVPF